MFKINGVQVDGDFVEALTTVFDAALDQAIAGNTILRLKASPGLGVVYLMEQIATSRGMKFRDVRADCIMPSEVESLPYIGKNGEIEIAEFDPLKLLSLEPDDQAIIMVTGLQDAVTNVADYFGNMNLPNKTTVVLEGDVDNPRGVSAESMTTALLSKIGFRL